MSYIPAKCKNNMKIGKDSLVHFKYSGGTDSITY